MNKMITLTLSEAEYKTIVSALESYTAVYLEISEMLQANSASAREKADIAENLSEKIRKAWNNKTRKETK